MIPAPPDRITVELLGDPVPKGRPRFASIRGRVVAFTPKKTRSYEADLSAIARAAMDGLPPMEGPLSMMVLVYLPIPKSWSKKKQQLALSSKLMPTSRPDIDNYAKLAADALNTIVYHDDAQIVSLTVLKYYSSTPLLHIYVGLPQC